MSLSGRLRYTLRVSAVVNLQTVVHIQVILLAVLLDNQLGHLFADVDPVTLSQLQDILKGKLSVSIGVALVHPLHSLIRKGLSPFMGLLTAQHINERRSRDIGIGSSESANNPIIFSQGFAPSEVLGGGSDRSHWYFVREFIIEEGNESSRGIFGEGLALALGRR